MKLTVIPNYKLTPNVRRDKLAGVPHLVVPVVAIKQGVLNGIFYPNEELEKFAQTWNGVPVPVGHPKDSNGNAVTANSKDSIDTVNIGIFLNVEFKNSSIIGEIWINIAKAKELGFEDVLDRLEQEEVMEVSTGLYAETVTNKGNFNGTDYELQISSIRPDHLALLPNEIGACSVAAGCGTMRTNCGDNKACSCGNNTNTTVKTPKSNGLLATLRQFFFKPIVNEESHDKIRQAISRALRETLPVNDWAYVLEVFDSYYVYEYNSKLFKQSYTLDDKGNAILVGEQKEVKVVTSYVPVSDQITNTMKPERKTALVQALALAALVGNASAVTDETKKPFEAMSDDMLNNMAKANNINLDDDGKAIVTNVVAMPPPLPPSATATAPITNSGLSVEERELLNTLKAEKEARITNKRTAVMAVNAAYTQPVVNAMDEASLDAILIANGSAAQAPAQPVVYGIAGAMPAAPVTNTTKRVRPSVLVKEEPAKA